jgi:hypothetical protein
VTAERSVDEARRSRWLPATVFSLFALVLLADVVVVVLYGNYRNLFEEGGLEIVFVPRTADAETAVAHVVETSPGARTSDPRGAVLVETVDDGLRVHAPGELKIRFRSTDAGAYVVLHYRFGERARRARVRLTLARVASRYGVDFVCRRSLVAAKRRQGSFRHYLADHAGWFELGFAVNPAAARAGFEITLPEIVWDPDST